MKCIAGCPSFHSYQQKHSFAQSVNTTIEKLYLLASLAARDIHMAQFGSIKKDFFL